MLDRRATGLRSTRIALGALTTLATAGFVVADAWSVVGVGVLLVATLLVARVDFGALAERDGQGRSRS